MEIFRYFIRKNWPEAGKELSNDKIDSLGKEFQKYIEKKVPEENRANFMPESAAEIIMQSDNPMRKNGFHHAYVMHFINFMDELKNTEESNAR